MTNAEKLDDIIKMNLVIMRNQFFIMGALRPLLGAARKHIDNLEMAAGASALQLIEWRQKHNVDLNTLEAGVTPENEGA